MRRQSPPRSLTLLALLGASALLVACGSGGDDNDGTADGGGGELAAESTTSDTGSEAPATGAPAETASSDEADSTDATDSDDVGETAADDGASVDPCGLIDDADVVTLLGGAAVGEPVDRGAPVESDGFTQTQSECRWERESAPGYLVVLSLFLQSFEPAMAEEYPVTPAQMAEGSATYDDVRAEDGLGAAGVSAIYDSEPARIAEAVAVIGDDVDAIVDLELSGPGSTGVASGATPDVLALRDELVEVARTAVGRL